MDVIVPKGYRVSLKQSEKYLCQREKSWNMKMRVVPVVIRALGTAPKKMEIAGNQEDVRDI